MKYIFFVLTVFAVVTCSTREKGAVLEKGSENYDLAQLFVEKVPEFNPDENIVVLSTKNFDVTIGDVIDRMRSRFGNKVESIAQSPRSSIIRLFLHTISPRPILCPAKLDAPH